jgi:thioredoxin 1
MAMIHYRRGEIDILHLLVGAILVGYLLVNLGKIQTYLFGYEPKSVPLIEANQIRSLSSSKPVFVYFYHRLSDDTAKIYLPVIDEFAQRYGDKVDFYRYQFNKDHQTEEFKGYWSNQSTLVMFQNGHEIKSSAATLGEPKFLPRGFAFKFIRDSVVKPFPVKERTDWFLRPDDFESKVLTSPKPVVVNFTCNTCPAAQMLEPHFKQIALENALIADFYMVDTNDLKNLNVIREYGARSTPTMVLFYNGKKVFRQSGAYSQREPNEALILGMISSYI